MSLPQAAVSEYTFYGKKTGNHYSLIRQGLKGNSVSEGRDTYNHWKVIENRYTPPKARVLLAPDSALKEGNWVHIFEHTYQENDGHADLYFEFVEDAYNWLKECIDEELVTE